jgi:hypothetical protein
VAAVNRAQRIRGFVIFGTIVVVIGLVASLPLGGRPPVTSLASDQPPGDTAEPEAPDEEEEGPKLRGEFEEGEEEEGEEGELAEEIKQRDAWFDEQRAVNGRIPKGAWKRARQEARQLRIGPELATDPLNWSQVGPSPMLGAAPMSPSGTFGWQYGGSTPYGGRVTSIATHPRDAKTAYVGTAMGGVWRTTDDGVSWTPIFDSVTSTKFPSLAIGAVAIDPNTPAGAQDVVYVGTGEANATTGYFGTGLYRSDNSGSTWAKLGGAKFDECGFSSIVVKKGDVQTIVVGVVSTLRSIPNRDTSNCASAGIYRTINGGATAADWTQVKPGQATRIVQAPNAADTMYAGIYADGAYKSTNGGQSWSKLTLSPAPVNPARVEISAAASPAQPPTQDVYVAVANTTGQLPRVYYSANGGSSWQASSSAFIGESTGYGFCGRPTNGQCGAYDLAIAADPASSTRAFVAGIFLNSVTNLAPARIGFAKPAPGSACPPAVTLPATTTCLHVDMHALTFDVNRRLWVGTDGGVWRSDNPRTTTPVFANLNATMNALMYYPGMTGSLGTQLLAGAQDNGTTRIAGGSATGTLVDGGDGGYAAVVGTGGIAFTTWQNLNLGKVVNGTKCNYLDATNGLSEAGDSLLAPFIAPVVASPADSNTAYAGTSYVWRTTNATAPCGTYTNWRAVSQRFTFVGSDGYTYGNINAIAAAKTGGQVYMGIRFGGKVYVGTVSTTWNTSATNWTERPLPVNKPVTDFAINPSNGNIVYVSVSGFGTEHIFKSTNGGATWDPISEGLPNSPASALALDTQTNPPTLYVGTDVGVFWTQDDGTNWQNTSVGLPPTVVHDLIVDPTAHQLIAATFGRGIWKAPLVGSAPAGPANDTFANASVATSLPFTRSGIDTTNATTQSGENTGIAPCAGTGLIGKTVWFRYTPTSNQSVTVDTDGSTAGYDTVLTAFRGSTLSTLTEIACDDDGIAAGGASRITALSLTAGQTYYFQVGGFYNTGGTPESGSLSFKIVATGAGNDAFGSATTIGSFPFKSAAIDTALATTEVNEDLDPSCSEFVGRTLWYKITPASTTTITADTVESSDGFDTVLVLYQGTSIGGLTELACDDDSGVAPQTGGSSRITSATLTGGQTYYLQVGGWRQTLAGDPDAGTLILNVKVAGLANDAFATTGTSTLPVNATSVSTTSATTEQGEDVDPSCTDLIGKTVWYKLTPAANMTITADTAGSNFDTVLVLFQGTTLAGLTEVACNDDGIASAGASRIATASLTGGQTYYLQVGGWQGATGAAKSGTLNVHISNIDSFAGAANIGQTPFSAEGLTTTAATIEAGENTDPSCSGTGFIGKTVWFKYTATANVTITADTSGSSAGYDTLLVLYRGTALNSLTEVACDDDGIASGGASRIASQALLAGQTYYFQVGGFNATIGGTPSSGSLFFHLTST